MNFSTESFLIFENEGIGKPFYVFRLNVTVVDKEQADDCPATSTTTNTVTTYWNKNEAAVVNK